MARLTYLRFVLINFTLMMALAACKEKPSVNKPKQDPPTVVDVIIANPQPVTNIIEANGTVVADEFVQLHPEVSGRITYLQVKEGDRVQKGTVIARINSADLAAQLQKSKAQLELAKLTEQRLKKLIDVGGVNQADYDAAVNNVTSLQSDINYTQALIDKTIIRAPFSGVVGLRQVSPGAFVTTADVIASIQQYDKIKIDFTLPESYADLIKKGSVVSVALDEDTGSKKKATIIAIEPQVNQTSRNLTVRAILQDGKPNPGAFVKVYIQNDGQKQAILVPTNAIIPDDKNNQLVLVKGGKATFVNITTGQRFAGNAEITKGINPGDTIVVTGVLFARPKSNVKIRSVKTLDQLK
ncbi:MAG: efflux RND transporter periplasmic adaptor subunit [Sphingobacteriales bacterium]|nr:efflux RND transporter periplasmic adaptor subunit [Sphingobacteriales bacterium]MBI3719024.1 efflux RND transporter periplasmic adaptor subunit [Sphingobacteriales bacterium]